jgi:metallo-beta-lactamase class B
VLATVAAVRPEARADRAAEVQQHVEAARKIAGVDWARAASFLCSTEEQVLAMQILPSQVGRNFEAQYAEPVKIFDNFYFVGLKANASWVIATSDGLILINAGYPDRVEPTVVAGLKKFGLDPAQVKYAIIPHSAEQYGGAKYFQDHYGSRVVLSNVDWDIIEMKPMPPRKDLVAADGQQITLGDEVVTLALIPGLTPGATGVIFPVKDNGKTHMVAMFGGTILNPAGRIPVETFEQYLRSVDHFADMTRKMHVDVEITHHPIMDGAFDKMARLRTRKPGDPHPFVVGEAVYQRFLNVMSECMKAQIARRTGA